MKIRSLVLTIMLFGIFLVNIGGIAEGNRPEIIFIDFPSKIRADAGPNRGYIFFKDNDGDIAAVDFRLVEGCTGCLEISPGWHFDPQVKGETEGTIEFSISTEVGAQYRLRVRLSDEAGNWSESYSLAFEAVEVSEPTFFRIRELIIEPSNPFAEEESTISAKVQNVGQESGTKYIKLYINENLVASQDVTLRSEESKVISWHYIFPAAGSYKVRVATPDDSKSINITVQEKPLPLLVVEPTTLRFEGVEAGPDPEPKSLIIKNEGTGVLNWNATVNVGWLKLDTYSGMLGAGEDLEVLVSPSSSGLAIGTYDGRISITGDGSELAVAVSLVISRAAPGTLLYQDDFSDPRSGWWTFKDDEAESGYENGKYFIALKVPWMFQRIRCPKGKVFRDFIMEVEAYQAAGPIGEYGFFWGQDWGDSYLYIIHTDGNYRLLELREDDWQEPPIPLTQSPAIRTGGQPNRLKVVVSGTQASLYVNNVLLDRVSVRHFDLVFIGLLVGTQEQGGVKAYFDNIKVYAG